MEQLLKKNNIKLPTGHAGGNRLQSSKSVRNTASVLKFDSTSNLSAYKKPGVPREVFLRSQYEPSDQSMEFYGTSSDIEMPGTRSPARTLKSESPDSRKPTGKKSPPVEPRSDKHLKAQQQMQAMQDKLKAVQDELARKTSELADLKK